MHRQKFILYSDQIPLNFLLHFSFISYNFLSKTFKIFFSDLWRNVRQRQQAACCSVFVHCYMQFTHQVCICIYFMHTVLIRLSLVLVINCRCYDVSSMELICMLPVNSAMKFIRTDHQCLFEIGSFVNHRMFVNLFTACVVVLTWHTVMWYRLNCL